MPRSDDADPLLTRKEACRLLNCSRTTLWRRECEGLQFTKDRIRLSALLHWARQQGLLL